MDRQPWTWIRTSISKGCPLTLLPGLSSFSDRDFNQLCPFSLHCDRSWQNCGNVRKNTESHEQKGAQDYPGQPRRVQGAHVPRLLLNKILRQDLEEHVSQGETPFSGLDANEISANTNRILILYHFNSYKTRPITGKALHLRPSVCLPKGVEVHPAITLRDEVLGSPWCAKGLPFPFLRSLLLL